MKSAKPVRVWAWVHREDGSVAWAQMCRTREPLRLKSAYSPYRVARVEIREVRPQRRKRNA